MNIKNIIMAVLACTLFVGVSAKEERTEKIKLSGIEKTFAKIGEIARRDLFNPEGRRKPSLRQKMLFGPKMPKDAYSVTVDPANVEAWHNAYANLIAKNVRKKSLDQAIARIVVGGFFGLIGTGITGLVVGVLGGGLIAKKYCTIKQISGNSHNSIMDKGLISGGIVGVAGSVAGGAAGLAILARNALRKIKQRTRDEWVSRMMYGLDLERQKLDKKEGKKAERGAKRKNNNTLEESYE